jgi:hypothetical protein
MISTRYALPVALILMLALVPTLIHDYLGMKIDDGFTVTNINPILDDFTSTPTNRQPNWGKDIFGSEDWFERNYTDKNGKTFRLFAGRSYDHKRLYHHPELGMSYSGYLRVTGQIRLPGQPEISVTLLHSDTEPYMAAYALLYDGKFIDDPFSHQIRDSLKQLVSPRKPMTLFYIVDDNAPKNTPFAQSPVASLLKKAIKDFMAQQH